MAYTEDSDTVNRWARLILKRVGLPMLILGVLLHLFVPTTKQAATMFVVPAIVNNQKVQHIAGNTLDIGVDVLELAKQHLEEHLKN